MIFSKTLEEYVKHADKVMQIIAKQSLRIKIPKCSFSQDSIHLLENVVSDSRVTVNPAKIEAIGSVPTPKTVTELRSFLGLAGYYRRFI